MKEVPVANFQRSTKLSPEKWGVISHAHYLVSALINLHKKGPRSSSSQSLKRFRSGGRASGTCEFGSRPELTLFLFGASDEWETNFFLFRGARVSRNLSNGVSIMGKLVGWSWGISVCLRLWLRSFSSLLCLWDSSWALRAWIFLFLLFFMFIFIFIFDFIFVGFARACFVWQCLEEVGRNKGIFRCLLW